MNNLINYTLECIILKRSNFSDADKIITVFAKRNGKSKVIAKGIRKIKSRRAPHVELFNKTKINLHKGKTFDIVTEAQSLKTYENLKKNLEKVNTAYFLAELVDKLCPELVEHDDVYTLLARALATPDEDKVIDQVSLEENFGNSLLHSLGFLPYEKSLKKEPLIDFIESIIEGQLKTTRLLTRIP